MYRGESDQKKVSRCAMYLNVKAAATRMGMTTKGWSVLALAGPNASDARCSRAILDTTDCTLLDTDAACLMASKEIAPWIQTIQGDLNGALTRPYSLVVADTCGTWGTASAIFDTWRRTAKYGAVLSLTWLLGRDTGSDSQLCSPGYIQARRFCAGTRIPRSSARVLAAMGDLGCRPPKNRPNMTCVTIDARWYNSGVSPMGMITVMRGYPISMNVPEHKAMAMFGTVESMSTVAGRMRSGGFSTEAIADGLCVTTPTTRALLACHTMDHGQKHQRLKLSNRKFDCGPGRCPRLRAILYAQACFLMQGGPVI